MKSRLSLYNEIFLDPSYAPRDLAVQFVSYGLVALFLVVQIAVVLLVLVNHRLINFVAGAIDEIKVPVDLVVFWVDTIQPLKVINSNIFHIFYFLLQWYARIQLLYFLRFVKLLIQVVHRVGFVRFFLHR